MGSLMGMGGGFVMIPLMTSQLALTQHVAHGTSLFAVAGEFIMVLVVSLLSTASSLKYDKVCNL